MAASEFLIFSNGPFRALFLEKIYTFSWWCICQHGWRISQIQGFQITGKCISELKNWMGNFYLCTVPGEEETILADSQFHEWPLNTSDTLKATFIPNDSRFSDEQMKRVLDMDIYIYILYIYILYIYILYIYIIYTYIYKSTPCILRNYQSKLVRTGNVDSNLNLDLNLGHLIYCHIWLISKNFCLGCWASSLFLVCDLILYMCLIA